MNGDRRDVLSFRLVGDHDQSIVMATHNNYTPCLCIEIPFARISHDLFKLGELKTSQLCSILQILGLNNHCHSIYL
jgi:hypothetical protein